MNILEIIILLFLVLNIIKGYRKGLIKSVVSIFAIILSIICAYLLNDAMSKLIINYTSIDDYVENKVYNQVEKVFDDKKNDVQDDVQDIAQAKTKAEEVSIIERMEVPGYVKQALLDNNHSEVYDVLEVDTIFQYISKYITFMIIKAMVFAFVFGVLLVIVKITSSIANTLFELPILNEINRIGGIIIGGIEGVVILWVAFIIFGIFISTEIGEKILLLVENSPWLSVLYDFNILQGVLTNVTDIIF